MKNRLLPLTITKILIALAVVLTVSGCININPNAPAPTGSPVPATTPFPTSTNLAGDDIIGFWEGSKNSIDYSIQFFNDGTLIYDEGGNLATGAWQKIDKKQYRIGILISDSVITLNDDMTQFSWGTKGVIFTKKM